MNRIAIHNRVLIQQKEIYSNRTHFIQTQLQKTAIERKPDYKDRDAKIGRVSQRITRKLGGSKEVNENNKRSYKKAVWQEKEEFIRTKGWWQCVAGG